MCDSKPTNHLTLCLTKWREEALDFLIDVSFIQEENVPYSSGNQAKLLI